MEMITKGEVGGFVLLTLFKLYPLLRVNVSNDIYVFVYRRGGFGTSRICLSFVRLK